MKLERTSLIIAAALALGLAGCSKNEPGSATADDANKAVGSTANAIAKTAEAAKAEATKVEAPQVADNPKSQGLIDKAKTLIAEGKYSDAASVLQQLDGQALGTNQQKLVEGLKEQLQKALAAQAAGDAAGDVGNLPKK